MSKKIIVVGGVAGGATAATRLRRLSEEDHIVMFERGEYISFANCGLPYYIGGYLVDVRDPDEVASGAIKGAINIPVNDLRDRLDEIPRDKDLYVSCQVGLRGYLAQRILTGNGIKSKNLDGGYTLYSAAYRK